MHVESLLQGGSGESGPTTGGPVGASGAVVAEGSAPAASATEFSVALGVLTAGALEEQPAVATPEVHTGPDGGVVAAELASELAVPGVVAQDIDLDATIGVVGSTAEGASGGDVPEGTADIPVVRGSSPIVDPSAVSPDAATVVAGGAEQSAALPTLGGEPGVGVLPSAGGPPTAARGLDPELRSGAPSGGQASARPGVLDASVAQSPAVESSTRAPADVGVPGTGTETTATTSGRISSGDGLASATGSDPAASSDETVPAAGGRQAAPGPAPSVEAASLETERVPTAGALETRAASRPEGNVEPTILAAVQPRVEARRLRDSASGIAASRAVPAAADPAAATSTDTATAIAGIDADTEEGSAGVALLRAGSDTGIAPAVQGLTREAVQRQRAQATLGQVSTVAGADPDASGTTLAPGTASQATPSTPASLVARIDQSQGFAALAERIVDGLYLSAARGGSEIRLRVDPPGLGHIDVRVQLLDDGVRAMIVAEHEGTRALLNGQQHLLEAALGRSELRLTGFSVDVSPDHGAADFHNAEHGDNDGASSSPDGGRGDGESTEDAGPAAPLDAGRLSLRV